MQPVRVLANRVRAYDEERFLAEFPAPVLVACRIISGRLGRSEDQFARATVGAGRSARLKPTTLLHIGSANAEDTCSEDAMVTRPLSRTMWIPLARGAATPLHAPITIGRAASCDVIINDYTVSKRHAYFVIDPIVNRYRLVDAGSTNGTRINDVWLEPGGRSSVTSGQSVTVGRLVCNFFKASDFWAYLQGPEDEAYPSDVGLG